MSSGNSSEFLEVLGEVTGDNALIAFCQGLTTVYYPLTPRQDLSYTTQRLYNFLDAIARLKGYVGTKQEAVRNFVSSTSALANPLHVDDLLSIIYLTVINELVPLLIANKPGDTNA